VALRMQQFFDTHLRGSPAPDWMVHGIPYRLKGRDQLAQPTVPAAGGPISSGPTPKAPVPEKK
jgi:hypothetical protein